MMESIPDKNAKPSSDRDCYWGTLVNPDKSPAPLLEQLCIGLAQLMAKLDSSNGSCDLTPDKLARFYREVGANYDTLFLDTKGPALSFIYQSLGCFHTLQPTTNPFEPPSVPALLPTGFVRWQVINLLLCPDEHAQYLQAALSRWDVVNPCDGSMFPKILPRDAFPETPDKDMVQWHEAVSQKLEQEHADQATNSSRRRFPADFVRYYSASPGQPKHHNSPAEDLGTDSDNNHKNNHRHFRENNNPPPPASRAFFDDQRPPLVDETRRYHRHRSPDDRSERRRRMYSDDLSSRAADSRNTSPRQRTAASPPAPTARFSMPMRAKTMRARMRQAPEQTMSSSSSSYRKHHKASASSSDSSSNGDSATFPQLRRRKNDLIDDYAYDQKQRNGRSSYLSPAQDPRLPRRHSHDAAAASSKPSSRDHHILERNLPRQPHQYPRAKFHDDHEFDGPNSPPPPRVNQPLPYEINSDAPIPRAHAKYNDGRSPPDYRGNNRRRSEANRGGSSGSGSGSSDRPRSSSNGSGESPWSWKGWNIPSRRRMSVHDI